MRPFLLEVIIGIGLIIAITMQADAQYYNDNSYQLQQMQRQQQIYQQEMRQQQLEQNLRQMNRDNATGCINGMGPSAYSQC
jgi:Tfp pilus assembly protein PilV